MIIKAAEDSGADLIVIGTHWRTGFGKAMLGSEALASGRPARRPSDTPLAIA